MKRDIKLAWIDNLRVAAIIAVVMLHVAAPAVVVLFNSSADSDYQWWSAHLFNSISRFCVPVFVMITGGLILPQQIGLKDFLNKRLKRIIAPFLFWSLIYLLFFTGLKIRDEGLETMNAIIPWMITQLVQGTAVHLWYVYMLIGLYLFIPIIKPWIQAASNKTIVYFLAIWLFTVIINQQTIIVLNSPLNVSYFSGYLGYLILGYYLAHRLVLPQSASFLAVVLFFAGFLITFLGTFLESKNAETFKSVFYDYLTLNVMMMATSVFIIFKSWNPVFRQATIKYISLISKFSFGIYLNHLLILSILSYFHIDYSSIHPIISIPIITLICLVLSCLIVYAFQKIPYGKYVSG